MVSFPGVNTVVVCPLPHYVYTHVDFSTMTTGMAIGLTPKAKRGKVKGRLSAGTIGPKKGVKRDRPVSAGNKSSARLEPYQYQDQVPLLRCRKLTMAGCCKARLTVTIGRLENGGNRWFVVMREGMHSGHPEVCCSLLARPTRLLHVDEVQIAGDALATHGGSATARALYFYRTGDLIDRITKECWVRS